MKKTFLLILLCLVGFVNADLAITNGDFELDAPVDGDLADIPEWYDPDPSAFWVGPWVKTNSGSYNGTAILVLPGDGGAVGPAIDGAGLIGFAYQSIGTKGSATNLTLSFEYALLMDQVDENDIAVTFTILESNGSFTPGEEVDILGATGVTVIDQVSTSTHIVRGVDVANEIWTFDLSSAGSGELFLRVNQYLVSDTASWIGVDNIEILTIDNEMPEEGTINVLTERDSEENDLVFTVYDARIETIDVQFGKDNDPNLTTDPKGEGFKIVEGMAVTPGQQYTVDLEGELAADLEYKTTYYWKVIGYDASSNVIEGPVSSFVTVPEEPVISIVSPNIAVAPAGLTAEFSVTGINVANYQWYKVGEAAPLADGDDYSGATTAKLTILDMQIADEGVFYCVGSNFVGSVSNEETGTGRAMVARLVNHYPMEAIGVDTTPDIVDGIDMALMSDDAASVGMPVLDSDVVDAGLGATSLALANLPENDPNGVYGQLPAGSVSYADMTISTWLKWSGDNNYERAYDFGNDDTHYMFLTPHNGSVMRFALRNGGGEQILDSAEAIVKDEWTFVAVTLSGDTAKLYVNGELQDVNEFATINTIDFDPQLNYFGKSQFAADSYFNGKLDDVKIFNYALTTEEVAQEYLDTIGGWVCDYDRVALSYDHNGNCVIDLADFAMFAATWMDSHRIYDDNN